MLKILILGGAGYLGSVLVPILLENGDDVTVLDNFRYSGDSLLNYSENLCDEDSIISPLSQYAKIKTEAERIIIEQPNTIALRLGTLFGVSSRMRMDLLINNLVYRAIYDKYAVLNAPTAFRNYLHVRDAANVFMFAIKYFSKMKGNVYNVGHIDLNLSQEDICLIIKKEIPNFYYFTHIENDLYDKRNYKVSMKKITKIGWKANVLIEEGIVELVKAFTLIKPNKYSILNEYIKQ